MFLISFSYAQTEMPGPPFSVATELIVNGFGDDFIVQLLAQEDMSEQFSARKNIHLSYLHESYYKITLRKN